MKSEHYTRMRSRWLSSAVAAALAVTIAPLAGQGTGSGPTFQTGSYAGTGTCNGSNYFGLGGFTLMPLPIPKPKPAGPETPTPIPDEVMEDPRTAAVSGGTVAVTGEARTYYRMPEPPAAATTVPMGVGLLYRSGTSTTATPGFSNDWHLTVVGSATTTMVNGEPTGVTWTSGGGDTFEGDPMTTPVEPKNPVTFGGNSRGNGGAGGAGAPPSFGGDRWFKLDGSLSCFRYYLDDNGDGVLERYRPDGSVMRYELVPSTQNSWRPNTFFDPFDNGTTYHWRADGKLERMVDPRGLEVRYEWAADGSSCDVEYHKGASHFAELDWGFTMNSGKVTSLSYPETDYVVVNAGSPLLDVSAPVRDRRTYSMSYNGNGLLEDVTDSRSNGLNVLHNDWVLYGGSWRVRSQTDEEPGVHDFTYTAVGSDLRVVYTEPGGNQYDFLLDSDGFPKEFTVRPDPVAGMPRLQAGDTPEPGSLTWQFDYDNCACGLVKHFETPSGQSWAMEHDSLGNVTKMTVLDPVGVGTVDYVWTHEPLARGGRISSYEPPVGATHVDYDYEWTPRSNGLFGEKPTSMSLSTDPIALVDGSTQTMTMSIDFDSIGRVDSITDVGGTVFDYSYVPDGLPGAGLLQQIERLGEAVTRRVAFTQDDFARITKIEVGAPGETTTTEFVNDAFGRPLVVTSDPGNGQVGQETRYFRDRYDNLAVELHRNLAFDGAAVSLEDGSSSGREWVRNEWHYYYRSLLDSFMDRRSLANGDDLADPTGGSDPWMAHYAYSYDASRRVERVTMPNGSTTRYVRDGYDRIYRVIQDEGGIELELGRNYFDVDLHPAETRQTVDASGTVATVRFHRNHGGKGYLFKVEGPSGIEALATYDSLGRVVRSEIMSGSGPVMHRATMSYDELGRVKRAHRHLLDAGGTSVATTETRFLYDVRSNIVEETRDEGRSVFRAFDQFGRLTALRDNLSADPTRCNEVELVWRPGRDLVDTVFAKLFEAADDGAPPAGVRKEFRYDYDHDQLGRVTAVHEKGLSGSMPARTTTFFYNSLGMVTRAQSPEQQGHQHRYASTVYDAEGRWVEFVKRYGAGSDERIQLRSEYDDHTANVETRRYDGTGNVTKLRYDSLYRLAEIVRPGAGRGRKHRTNVYYDVASKIDFVVDGNGTILDYDFGVDGRPRSITANPGAGVSRNATKEVFDYDAIGRLESMRTNLGAAGADLMASVDFEQDSLGRLTRSAFGFLGVAGTTDLVHGFAAGSALGDPEFRRSLDYASGFRVETDPDVKGRLQTVRIQPAGSTANYEAARYRYFGESPHHRAGLLGDGSTSLSVQSSYDGYNRMTGLTHQVGGQPSPITDLGMDWDDAGNLTRFDRERADGSAGNLFAYDDLNRLVGAKLGVPSGQMAGGYAAASFAKEIVYDLDPGNSRAAVITTLGAGLPSTLNYVTQNASPRYRRVGAQKFVYDGEGNLLFDGSRYYVYDFKNRLSEVYAVTVDGVPPVGSGGGGSMTPLPVAVSLTRNDLEAARDALLAAHGDPLPTWCQSNGVFPGSGQIEVSGQSSQAGQTFGLELVGLYGYDPTNRRLVRMAEGRNLRSTYDGWQETEVFEVVGSTAVADQVFVWGSGIDELLAYYRNQNGTWVGHHVTQDAQSSVYALLDARGNLVEEVEYDPYGTATFYVNGQPGPQTTSSVGNPYTFHGRRLDPESGLVYFRHRYLHTGIGRWTTIDPLGSWTDTASGGNGYVFVGNTPMVLVDPSGLLAGGASGGTQGGPPGQSGATGGQDTLCIPKVKMYLGTDQKVYFYAIINGQNKFVRVDRYVYDANGKKKKGNFSEDPKEDRSGFIDGDDGDGGNEFPYLSGADLQDGFKNHALDSFPGMDDHEDFDTSIDWGAVAIEAVLWGSLLVPGVGVGVYAVGRGLLLVARVTRVMKLGRTTGWCMRAGKSCTRFLRISHQWDATRKHYRWWRFSETSKWNWHHWMLPRYMETWPIIGPFVNGAWNTMPMLISLNGWLGSGIRMHAFSVAVLGAVGGAFMAIRSLF